MPLPERTAPQAHDVTGASGATYTHGYHDAVLASHRWRTAANSAAYLTALIRPGMHILDVGCGPGTITVDLAALAAPGTTLGLDVSEELIAGAAASYGQVPGLSFATGDISHLAADAGTYDIVHAHQVLQHLGDPVAALGEMRRVVRPGGIVAARDADYSSMAYFPRLDGLDEFIELYREVAHRNGGEPDAGRYLQHWARQAGFSEVTSSASAWCYATPAEVQWWSQTWATRVTSSGIARTALAEKLATAADLERLAAAWRAWGAHPDAWFAVLHGEIIARG